MRNLSKFVAVALIALSTACALRLQEETAPAAPAPAAEETNTEESSADNGSEPTKQSRPLRHRPSRDDTYGGFLCKAQARLTYSMPPATNSRPLQGTLQRLWLRSAER